MLTRQLPRLFQQTGIIYQPLFNSITTGRKLSFILTNLKTLRELFVGFLGTYS